jgi:hypothetical protein
MSFLILPGRYLNILDGCLSITASDPEAGYDAEDVANNVPSHPFKFDDPGTDDYLLADLNRLENSDFETWAGPLDSQPDAWEVSGTVSKESTIKHGGSYSAKMLASSEVTQIRWVPSGWDVTVDAWLYGDGTYYTYGSIQNLYTGNWLTTGGAWQASSTNWGGVTAASWTQKTLEFAVEGYSICGYQHLVPLRVRFHHAVSGSGGYVDDAALWPHWDFASLHGHNIPPSITLKYQSDDNSGMSSPTTQATATVIQPSFYDTIGTAVKERYARLLLEGTVYQPKSVLMGEWVLGQYKTLTKGKMELGPDYTRIMPITQESSISRTPRSDWSHRGLRLDFLHTGTALTNMYEMLDRARGGADPFVIVPISTESDVMFGYFPTSLRVNRMFLEWSTYQLEFREMAFPLSF